MLLLVRSKTNVCITLYNKYRCIPVKEPYMHTSLFPETLANQIFQPLFSHELRQEIFNQLLAIKLKQQTSTVVETAN